MERINLFLSRREWMYDESRMVYQWSPSLRGPIRWMFVHLIYRFEFYILLTWITYPKQVEIWASLSLSRHKLTGSHQSPPRPMHLGLARKRVPTGKRLLPTKLMFPTYYIYSCITVWCICVNVKNKQMDTNLPLSACQSSPNDRARPRRTQCHRGNDSACQRNRSWNGETQTRRIRLNWQLTAYSIKTVNVGQSI